MKNQNAILYLGIALSIVIFASVQSNAQIRPVKAQTFTYIAFDQLEYTRNDGANLLLWELTGWTGGDYNRFWIKSEGDLNVTHNSGEGEFQALYSRLIAPFWEFQSGVRTDLVRGGGTTDTRALFVIGLEGLAPYWFEVEPALFISHKGDLSARFAATYDLRITQRLIAQPSLEVNAAIQDVPEFEIASGLNDIGLDFRLQYEVKREFAPYVGISYTRKLGNTADLAKSTGESVSETMLMAGFRFWR